MVGREAHLALIDIYPAYKVRYDYLECTSKTIHFTSVDFIYVSSCDPEAHTEENGSVECGSPTANLEGKTAAHEANVGNAGCNVDESSCRS